MAIPRLSEDDELPAGVYPATIQETLQRFGGPTRERQLIGRRLERIVMLARDTGHLLRLVVFGSFVTAKPDPNDVDVFLLMDDGFDLTRLSEEQDLLFDHAAADAHFGASVFWVRRLAALGGEQAAIEFWQTRRDGGQRGIIEIVWEDA